MNRRPNPCLRALSLTAVFALALGASRSAHAGIDACGDIDLNADAKCKIEVEGGCEVQCEPARLNVACAGKLQASCEGSCEGELDAGCTADCSGACEATCEVDPGDFDCNANCSGGCEAECQGHCSADLDSAECAASCEATCGVECSASCEGTPPSASCEGKCEASCSGECHAEANFECQATCQADGYVSCKADLELECDAQCKRPEGAIFCDGQFVNADKVDECAAALKALLNIQVEGSADADCNGNTCEAEAQGSVSCALPPAAPTERNGWPLLGLTALAALAQWRRTRR